MNLRELEVFQTVCEEESFTRAAKRLCMTQPAVSHVISSLETETGSRLFDRLSRRIYLTGAGRAFLAKSIPVLEAYAELAEEIKKGEDGGLLRLGSSITIANTWLPQVVRELAKRWPRTPVRVTVASAAAVEKSLAANDLDMAFIEGNINEKEWSSVCVASYKMVFFCSEEHAFAGREDVTAKELAEQPLVLRERGSAIRDTLDSALSLRHIVAEPAWTSTNSQALIQAVKQNLGVSILPECLLETELPAGRLRLFRVEGMELSNQSSLVTHRDKHWTSPMKDLAALAMLNT